MVFTRLKRVLIIGGGAAGLVSLRNLTERGDFEDVQLVERRDDVGGIWYLDQPSPEDCSPRWPSPSYPGLVGNVLPEHLTFSGAPFPLPATEYAPFPTLVETYNYLRNFASPFLEGGKIRLSHEVVRVDELEKGWNVVLRKWKNGTSVEITEKWDAVVVATSWYDTPAYPQIDGLQEAKSAGLVVHAKWYRGPQGYEGKRVLVVGNANSSNDMASQLVKISQTPVYRAIRRPPNMRWPALPDPLIRDVAPLAKMVLQKNNEKVSVLLTDGTVIPDIDTVFLGTGYIHTPYFFKVFNEQKELVPLASKDTVPARVPALHRQILYARNPTLAWIGVVVSYTAFTLADLSSTWLSLAWSSPGKFIPSTQEEMLLYEKTRLAQIKSLRDADGPNASSLIAFHVLGSEEKMYARHLREDVVSVERKYDAILPTWTDEDWERRIAMYKVKYDWLKAARDKNKELVEVQTEARL